MTAIKRFSSWFSNQKFVGKAVIGAAGVILLCCLCSVPIAILSPSSTTSQVNNTTETDVESIVPAAPTENPPDVAPLVPSDTPVPSSTPFPTETPNPNVIMSGTYLVGVDIRPGIYKGSAGQGIFDSCYWERLKDLTGSFDAILANDNSVGQYYIEVKESDYALKTDCQLVRLETLPDPPGEYPQFIEPGTYLVGSDIRPGTYRGQAGSDILNSCYWERQRSVSGDFDSILANDNATGQYYIQVLPSDFSLQIACEMEWVGE